MAFIEMLKARWRGAGTLLCVGLDPDPARFPKSLRTSDSPSFEFCKAIVDATADLVCAFKPQIAYFASAGAESELQRLIDYIRQAHPAVPVILDAKRGDMASTAQHYAREVFERYNAHAVTLSPYLGFDSIEPYLSYRDRGAFLLCRTSNAGGDDLQMLRVDGELLYQRVARLAKAWNRNGQLGLVVGATYPNELARVRELVDDMPLLVPGIGAQGGDVQAAVTAGQTAEGAGLVISSSRAILYASQGDDFADAAQRAARSTRDEINRHRLAAAATS
jgi:orotidine-5'-phosphate decarboxylase